MPTPLCDSSSLDAVFADFLFEREQDPALHAERFAARLPGSLRRSFLDEWQAIERFGALPATSSRAEVAGYRLLDCIGQGASARVFAAEQPALGRRVAIKVLHAAAIANDCQAPARMRREARVLAALRHPSIVAVHDVVQIDGQPALVMQLAPGRVLRALVQALGDATHAESAMAQRLLADPHRVAATFAGLASALAHAHARGVVHRDVKPGNIVLDEEGHATLLDFGLARTAEDWASAGECDVRTGAGDLLGTPLYMAPEQLAGQPAGPAADVWALGSVLQECLTGHAASGPDARLPRRLPSALRRLIRRCRQRDPRRRPSAAWLAGRLHAVAARVRCGTVARCRPWRWLAVVAACFVLVDGHACRERATGAKPANGMRIVEPVAHVPS